MKNFHVPLSEEVYQQLRALAETSGRPATALAREAIEAWLKQQRRAARDRAIAEFAVRHAGGSVDLDAETEAAGREFERQ